MESVALLKKFLNYPNHTPPTQSLSLQAQTEPYLTQLPEMQTYDPMFYEDFDPMQPDCEFPELSIDEISGSITSGQGVGIKKERMLDHRSILQVFCKTL